LPPSSTARCRALFTTHSEFGDITPTQYDVAYHWLQETGLLRDLIVDTPARYRVFAAALSLSGASWLSDADLLVQSPDEIPEDALRAAIAVGITDEEAYAQIIGVWGHVDAEARKRVGAAGEKALVELLAGGVDGDVRHVSLVSDGFGYDISVSVGDRRFHLEAKATTRRGRLTLFLSRHECEVMRRDPSWYLVVVRLDHRMEPTAVAVVPRSWVVLNTPADRGTAGRWESCRLEVPHMILEAGIPPIEGALKPDASGLLGGLVPWPG
jgi:hypothetical protein